MSDSENKQAPDVTVQDSTGQEVQLVTVASLPPEAKQKAEKIAETIDLDDSQMVVQYGVGAQSKISSFADTILTEIRTKDAGYVGDVLNNLVVTVKNVDVGSLTEEPSGLAKLFGGLKRKIQRFMNRYDDLSGQIDKVVDELEQARMSLLKDIALLDNLYEKNQEHLQDLDVYIAAGKLKLDQARQTILPELEKKAQESGDPADAQRLHDFNQMVNRFEKKLHDMQLSRMVALQTAPQVRLIQNNNQTLVEKIQSSILNTIPLWKNQVIIAISLFRQKKALEIQKNVSDTTNDLLARNAEMLKQGSIGVAKESERGIVEIDTLKKVNDDLISTIEETLRIQQEGREKRKQAEGELQQMEQQLKDRLRSVQTEGAGTGQSSGE